jgi:hypothetical protein
VLDALMLLMSRVQDSRGHSQLRHKREKLVLEQKRDAGLEE